MLNKEIDIIELSDKVLKGMKIAIKKLVEETAAKGGNLVIGDADGTIKKVPAKDLLPLVNK